jgi:hypothetical protein
LPDEAIELVTISHHPRLGSEMAIVAFIGASVEMAKLQRLQWK